MNGFVEVLLEEVKCIVDCMKVVEVVGIFNLFINYNICGVLECVGVMLDCIYLDYFGFFDINIFFVVRLVWNVF